MEDQYLKKSHLFGKISVSVITIALVLAPFLACLALDCSINWEGFLKGFLQVAPLYYTVAIIEVITYIPMLGTGGTYISFITGNISNLKLPAALNALDQYGTNIKTPEGEVISTISNAVSSLVNTVIIIIGVILIAPFGSYLENPILAPAFNNVIPALFGALAIAFIGKNYKLAVAPLILMIVLFVSIPALNAGTVGIMVPVAVVFTLIVNRILYKKGKI